MKPNHETWALLADSTRGRLIRLTASDNGHPIIRETAHIEEHWEEKEHHRASPLGPDKAGHSYASHHHEDEERLRRFAGELARWTLGSLTPQQIHALTVCAPPRVMGALRRAWPAGVIQSIHEIEIDVAGWSMSRLARHPALREVCQVHATARS